MIRWCAYCQTYQGERPPRDDHSITHTICARCDAQGRWMDESAIEGVEPIRAMFARIANVGSREDPRAIVDEALELGIAPLDLLLGVIQPVLFDVGERWARGEAAIEEEREITRRCLLMYEALLKRDHSLVARRLGSRPDVLLAAAPGNSHSIGLRMIEIFLLAEGVSTRLETDLLGESELIALTNEVEPRLLALSAALPEHLDAAVAIASHLDVPVVIGGRAATQAGAPHRGLRHCRDFRELPKIVRRMRDRGERGGAEGARIS